MAWLVLAAVVAALAATGGFDDAPPRNLPQLSLDTPIEASPFELTFTRAYTTSVRPGDLQVLEPSTTRYIVIEGTLIARDDQPVRIGTTQDAIRVLGTGALMRYGKPEPDASKAQPVLWRRGASIDNPQPDLLMSVAWYFEQNINEPAPDAITLQVYQHLLRRDMLLDYKDWRDPKLIGELALTLERR